MNIPNHLGRAGIGLVGGGLGQSGSCGAEDEVLWKNAIYRHD